MSDQYQQPPTEVRIADGVLTVIATRGFDVVSVRTVAEECGISAGTVQYHFPTRQELLTAGLLRSFDRQQQAILSEGQLISTFQEMHTTLTALLPLKDSLHEDATAWVSFVAAAGSRPWLAEIISKALTTLQDYLTRCITSNKSQLVIRPGIEPDRAARLITILLDGLTIDLLAVPDNSRYARDDLKAGLALILERD